jgi:RHS repeat-associated protein
MAVTLQAGTGTVSPTATTSGPAAPSNASFYYHTDHQGSVRAVTDQSGAVVNSYAYDSYGTAEESVESLAQRFRYTGREYDALTGLYHYRARAFDPETARFLQEDPLWFGAGDMNVYRMTWNNPVNWTDPSGMSAVEDGGLRGAIMKAAPGVAYAGNAVSCGFSVLAGIIDVINTAQNEGFSIQNVATYTVRAGGIALECGAGTKAVKKLYDSCGGSILIETAFFGAGLAAANIDFLLSYGKSFDGETKIMTRAGYAAIKAQGLAQSHRTVLPPSAEHAECRAGGRRRQAHPDQDDAGASIPCRGLGRQGGDHDRRAERQRISRSVPAVPVRRRNAVRRLGERRGAEGRRQGVDGGLHRKLRPPHRRQ